MLSDEIARIWAREPSWQWDHSPFTGGMRERILWKLANKKTAKTYYRAIIHEDFFVFAIAADLYSVNRLEHLPEPAFLTDILGIAHDVLQREVVWQPNGGWLFQPGVWTDHPDYLYAGRMVKTPDLQPMPVTAIGADSSHSHYFALWLTSLMDADQRGGPDRRFYEKLRRGLEIQFFTRILVPPAHGFSGFRMNNFVDGHNGIYRWKYRTLGDSGYGPYELSGTLALGWWTFLDSDEARSFYTDLATQFPLPDQTRRLYGISLAWFNSPRIGFLKLIVDLAAHLCGQGSQSST